MSDYVDELASELYKNEADYEYGCVYCEGGWNGLYLTEDGNSHWVNVYSDFVPELVASFTSRDESDAFFNHEKKCCCSCLSSNIQTAYWL